MVDLKTKIINSIIIMMWIFRYFKRSPDVIESDHRSSSPDKINPHREKELNGIIEKNDRLFEIFKNTVISYIFRKQFLKLIHASIVAQRTFRQKRKFPFILDDEEDGGDGEEHQQQQLLRRYLKDRSNLYVELRHLNARINSM
jgi:hypothetical protein